MDEKTAKRLEMIVKLGKGLNVFLIISEDPEELGKLASVGNVVSMLMISSKRSILLGQSFKAHTVFRSDLPYNEAEAKLGEFEAYILKGEHAERFKTMYEKE